MDANFNNVMGQLQTLQTQILSLAGRITLELDSYKNILQKNDQLKEQLVSINNNFVNACLHSSSVKPDEYKQFEDFVLTLQGYTDSIEGLCRYQIELEQSNIQPNA